MLVHEEGCRTDEQGVRDAEGTFALEPDGEQGIGAQRVPGDGCTHRGHPRIYRQAMRNAHPLPLPSKQEDMPPSSATVRNDAQPLPLPWAPQEQQQQIKSSSKILGSIS